MFGLPGGFVLDVKVDGQTYPVGEGRLKKLQVHEMATYMAPMAELGLEDRLNFLMELSPLTGAQVFDIKIGRTEDDVIQHQFRIFKPRATRSGSDSHLVKVYLLSDVSKGLFSPGRYKGYAAEKISDVVKEIASDVGLTATSETVEETDGTFDLFCPGWTYAQFLAWLADRARSTAHGTCGFLYFVDLDDRLHFYSADWAKSQKPVLNMIRKDPAHEEDYDEKDVHLHTHRVFQNQWLMGGQGAFGATSTYFDFESGDFVERPLTIDGADGVTVPDAASGFTDYTKESNPATAHLGLADDVAMLDGDQDPRSVVLNHGVALGADDLTLRRNVLEAKVLRATNSIVKLEVLIDGDLRMRAGSLVTVELGSPHPQNIINQVFSGKWVVERVTHDLVPQFLTKALLFRSTIGGSDNPNLVTPPGGVIK